jgi:tRNA G26 N,N-dimethylase Trm1
VREGNLEILCEGEAYSGLQSANRDLSVKIFKEYFRRAGRDGEELSYLDLFCGSGIRALLFCDSFPHGNVIGVDHNLKYVESATRNATINQLDSVKFLCQDVLSFVGDSSHFDVIEMDPFGGCLPYLEHFVPYLKDGGLLALTFTNSRELFPSHCDAGQDKSSNSYVTHGIPRPHPDIGAHEFGLRSTWLAVSKKLSSMKKVTIPVCSWAFQHGCRIIACVSDLSLPRIPSTCASLYVDSSNSFAIVFPSSVTCPVLTLSLSHDRANPRTVSVSFVGETWGHSLLDEELISSVLQKCQSLPLQSLLARLLETSSVFRSPYHEGGGPLWGVFARKKFMRCHLSGRDLGAKKVPSLGAICRILNEHHAPDVTVSLPQDQDSYLVPSFLLPSSPRLLHSFTSDFSATPGSNGMPRGRVELHKAWTVPS